MIYLHASHSLAVERMEFNALYRRPSLRRSANSGDSFRIQQIQSISFRHAVHLIRVLSLFAVLQPSPACNNAFN